MLLTIACNAHELASRAADNARSDLQAALEEVANAEKIIRRCVCVCVFIKLHITTHSGPVILVILCHSHWPSQGNIKGTCYENL